MERDGPVFPVEGKVGRWLVQIDQAMGFCALQTQIFSVIQEVRSPSEREQQQVRDEQAMLSTSKEGLIEPEKMIIPLD